MTDGQDPVGHPPTWQPAKPADSLSAFSVWLEQRARLLFLKDGTHVPLLVICTWDGQMQIETLGAEREKTVELLREAIETMPEIYGVIYVAEAWTYVGQPGADATFAHLTGGEMNVSDLPPEQRQESLVMVVQSRAGQDDCRTIPILRDPETKAATLGAGKTWQGVHGMIGKLFT